MTTYVRERLRGKWHIARAVLVRAMLPGEYTATLCNRSLKAREITPDKHETDRDGLCYQCSRKENHG